MAFEIDTQFGRMELDYGPFFKDGVSYPANVLDLWSDAELGAIGVYRVPDRPKIRCYRPIDIVRKFKEWGVAEQILASQSEVDKAEFFASVAIDESEPRLVAALTALGKTADDLGTPYELR